jgi:fermentation-respiration switch protein FrsA (DUF1100 family)
MPVSTHVLINGDVPLVARQYRGDGDPAEPLPAVIVTGSWLTVKEQMAHRYAAALAERGYAAFTFDFAGFGESAGTLRQTEIPLRKMADLAAVVRFVAGLSTVANGGPGVLGICASAQYTLGALAAGVPIASFASVAGWFHDRESVAGFYGGAAGVADRLSRADDAARRYASTGELHTVPAYAPGDERAGMFVELDYYANPQRGAVPAWRNEMTELTWAHWLTFDGLAAAPAVDVPTLFVHSDDCVFPANVRAVAAAMPGPAEVVWGEGMQIDFYDRPAQVGFAVDAADAHFRRTVGGGR